MLTSTQIAEMLSESTHEVAVMPNYVKLVKLVDLEPNDVTWQKNVHDSGVAEGYTFAEGDPAEGEDFVCAFMDEKDMQPVDIDFYDFMGGGGDLERFYIRDNIQAFKHRWTGEYWALYTGEEMLEV